MKYKKGGNIRFKYIKKKKERERGEEEGKTEKERERSHRKVTINVVQE